MALYFKIKKSDVAQEQINFSTSKNISEARILVEKGIIWDTEWVILKTEDDIFKTCTCFNSLKPYSVDEMLNLLNGVEE